MILERLEHPVILAPLAGGPSTPELTAAVSDAGGFGFLATGYLDVAATAGRIEETRRLTSQAFGVNLFVPGEPSDPGAYAPYVERLTSWAADAGLAVGEPRHDDDDWEAKLELLAGSPPSVVSFTFGCPSPEVVGGLRAAGSEVWVTITSPEEARLAVEAGADALIVQGAEAGGHRASFIDSTGVPALGLLPLLDLVRAAVRVPLIASGGIASGRALAAVLCAGATAGQIGTAFMLAPEAGTHPVHRDALKSPGETVLTRAFTGRLARGIRNAFIDEHEAAAPIAYPEVHYVTSPTRRAARERGDAGQINLWAGEAHELAVERPAAETVRALSGEARAVLARASATWPE